MTQPVAADTIVMTNPTTGGVGLASPEQFEILWKSRGWTPVEFDLKLASKVVGAQVTSISDLEVDDIKRVLAAAKPAEAPETSDGDGDEPKKAAPRHHKAAD